MCTLKCWFIWRKVVKSFGPPRWHSGKGPACHCRRRGFDTWVRKVPWGRKWQPTPVFSPGKFHGQRSLVGYNPCGQKETQLSDWATEPTYLIFLIHINTGRDKEFIWKSFSDIQHRNHIHKMFLKKVKRQYLIIANNMTFKFHSKVLKDRHYSVPCKAKVSSGN